MSISNSFRTAAMCIHLKILHNLSKKRKQNILSKFVFPGNGNSTLKKADYTFKFKVIKVNVDLRILDLHQSINKFHIMILVDFSLPFSTLTNHTILITKSC